MANKKKSSFSKAILSLLIAVPTVFSLINKLYTLVGLEARLAGKSLVTIIVSCVLFAMILTTTWICLLMMLFLYLTSLHWNPQLSLLLIVFINLLVLSVIAWLINKAKNNLSFPITRKHLHNPRKAREDY